MLRLTVTTDLRVYFSDVNPQLAALEELEAKYGGNETLYFLVVADDSIYTRDCLRLVYDLTEAGWQLPYAFRSSSLANYRYTRSTGDTLLTSAIVEDPAALTDVSIAAIRALVADEPALADGMISDDGAVTGVAVRLAYPQGNRQAVNDAVAAGRALAASLDVSGCGRIVVAGSATNSVTLGEAVRSDIQSLVIISYLTIAAGLLLLLRSVAATVLIMIVISLSVAATMGIFGWLGYVLSPTAGFVPSVVLTIAVADCVHVVSNYLIELGHGRRRNEAIAESLRINLGPVAITSVTTAIGMLSLNFSDSPPYRDLGNMVAVGVGVAFVLSLTLLPAMMALTPALSPPRFARQLPVTRFADWLIAHYRRILAVGIVAVAVIAAFIGRNELTERWHEYFTEHFEIRRAVDLVNDRLDGIHRLYYDLETGQANGISDPAYVADLDAFAEWLLAQEGVAYVSGLHTTLKMLNRAFHDNSPRYYRLPDSRAANAQLLLLQELSLPQGESLDSLIDQDRSASRLVVSIEKTDSESLLELDRRALAWLQRHAPAIEARAGTGLDLVFAHITHRNIRALLTGTAIALMVISLLLIVVLRSVRLGLVSLLPNLAPAALAYGLWGIGVGYIDLALSVVVCMSLGIVVDDTVHFMSKYTRARREHGLDAAGGIHHAFRTVGMALVITSIVLVAGFAVLAFSHFNPTRETGTLLAITIAIALVVDFLLLPPLLLAVDD